MRSAFSSLVRDSNKIVVIARGSLRAKASESRSSHPNHKPDPSRDKAYCCYSGNRETNWQNLLSRWHEPVMIVTPLAGRERDRPSKARAISTDHASRAFGGGFWRKSLRRTLPTFDFGKSSRNSTNLGTL
jgi:hypothetical protein